MKICSQLNIRQTMIIVGTYLNKQVEDNEKQNLENPQIHHMMAINKLVKKFSFESDTSKVKETSPRITVL